ncbi:hypothetical protein Tco_1029140 [Tanacetum coccineum]|uniref:Uncharacterized protein n=1 Tax=Tanacetum coccineum TaxID=301880 RepID=A0ABQ5G346_9ASTR
MSNKELESKVEDMVEEVKTKMGELFGTYKERFDFLSSNSSMGEHMESEVDRKLMTSDNGVTYIGDRDQIKRKFQERSDVAAQRFLVQIARLVTEEEHIGAFMMLLKLLHICLLQETILYSTHDLRKENKVGISTIFYLQKIFPDAKNIYYALHFGREWPATAEKLAECQETIFLLEKQ